MFSLFKIPLWSGSSDNLTAKIMKLKKSTTVGIF